MMYPLLGQDQPRSLAPGAVPAGNGNPYQLARQLPARLVLFTAQPLSVKAGDSVTLEWATENATGISIGPEVGRVTPRGSMQVFPNTTTTYTLTIKGPNDQVLTRDLTVKVAGSAATSARSAKAIAGGTGGHPDLNGVYDYSGFGPQSSGINPAAPPALKAGAERFKIVRGPDDAGPTADCRPLAPPQAFNVPYQFQIVQNPAYVVIFYEYPGTFRIIPTGGGPHQKDLDPTWMGDSVGRWEGDTLVIDTMGFNDKTELLGFKHTEDLHLVERFKRNQEGNLAYAATVEDPNVFEKPWTLQKVFPRRPELTKIGEFVCENNHDYSGLFKKE